MDGVFGRDRLPWLCPGQIAHQEALIAREERVLEITLVDRNPIPDSCRYSNPEVGCLLCPICCRWVYACGRSKNRKIAMNGAEWFEAYTATSSNGLPFRFCSHQPEPRLARCLFSPGRVPRFPSSISRDATEQSLGMDSFVPQFRYERNISGLEAKRATFRTIQLP